MKRNLKDTIIHNDSCLRIFIDFYYNPIDVMFVKNFINGIYNSQIVSFCKDSKEADIIVTDTGDEFLSDKKYFCFVHSDKKKSLEKLGDIVSEKILSLNFQNQQV